MAKKERQKRAARKARQKERAEREERAAAVDAAGSDKDAKKAPTSASSKEVKKADKKDKPKKKGRIRTYFTDVRTELHRVVWPSRAELKNYSIAVIVMLIVFGVAIWLVDTGVLAVLAGYTGLRG